MSTTRHFAILCSPNKRFRQCHQSFDHALPNTALFFAAIAVYFFLQNRNRSPIGILTQAEYKSGIIEENRNIKWSTFTDAERDLEMANEILKVLTAIKRHCEQPQNN